MVSPGWSSLMMPGFFSVVGHDHRFHVAGDGFGVEGDGTLGGVGGDDDSANVAGLFRLRLWVRRRGVAVDIR